MASASTCKRFIAIVALICLSTPAFSQPGTIRIETNRQVHHDTSRPLRDILAELQVEQSAKSATDYVVPNRILDPASSPWPSSPLEALGIQRAPSGAPMPATSLAVNGLRIGLGGGGVPPDTTGDVGPDHFFQWVNTSWALFNKTTGAITSGPTPGSSFWSGFGGLCQSTNRGDPLVLFDDHAQRWVVSQFAFALSGGNPAAPFLQCVAVSTSADPLGSYHRYAFQYPVFNDYGKMGVWRSADGGQNAYLLTMHEFAGSFQGTSFAAIERDRMLQGESAQFIRVSGINAFGALPLHLEGIHPLPAGACPLFVHYRPNGDGYRIWDLCLDWSTGTTPFVDQPRFIASEPYVLGLSGIPQASSSTRLDDFGGNLMYLAAARAFGPQGPLEARAAINHAVDVGADQAGLRWVVFGLRGAATSAPTAQVFADGFEKPAVADAQALAVRVLDQGTYAPDGENRWMGGINIDANANIGVGYNASSAAINPEVRLSGRERLDPAGTLRDELTCTPPGTGAQTGLFSGRARWGDYATMALDPNDQCTFWFTNEYYPVTSNSTWNTRICAFRFNSCGQPDYDIEVQPAERLQVCGQDGDPELAVRIGGYAGFNGLVSLSAAMLPAGVSAAFTPSQLTAGETATLLLSGAAGLAAGPYQIRIDGSAAAARSLAVDFDVSAAPAAPPALLSPGNATTGISVRPSLNWDPVPGANRYEIALATDAAFANIIDSAVVEATQYTAAQLLPVGQTVFWRVRSLNACGPGNWSPARSFTTGAPGSCPTGTNPSTLFSDDVAGDAIAWTTENVSGDAAAHWSKRIPPAGTGLATRAWYAGNSATTADQRLISPAIVLPAGPQTPIVLGFDAHHRYETDGSTDCWDGGFVEISTDGGATYAPLGNLRNLADPYPGTLSSGNPAQGELAWCRQPQPGTAIRTWFALDEFAGQSIRLRFRSTADSNTVGPTPNGWAVDNVLIQSCQ